jgi:methylphosphotriester-DNA--protein-cysteine methyltransferase
MTQEDLDQIGNLISANNQVVEDQTRSLISANNQVLFEAMRAIEDHVDQSIGRLRDELSGGLAHVERGERLDSEMSATQTARQRAIDDLARRLTKVERQINPLGSQSGPA